MKKITAFFMAIFPFMIVLILFATGLIVKESKYIDVKYIEVVNDNVEYKKETLDSAEYDFSSNIVVNPSISTDPVVYYQSTNTDIVDFQGQQTSTNGKATVKDFSDDVVINVWAKAKPDDVKHFKFSCVNDKVLGIRADDVFMVANGTTNAQATTIPSTHVTSKLKYSTDEEGKKLIDIDENTGTIDAKTSDEGFANVHIENDVVDKTQQVSKDIKVYIIPNITTVGFKTEETSVLTNSTKYNIFNELVTQPTNVQDDDKYYFKYISSDESVATVNNDGVVTFKQPHKPVDIYVCYRADELVYAKRTITSTMENYVDVAFNKYTYTANMNDFLNNQEITDIKYSTYPAIISGNKPVVTSSNTNVVKIENDRIFAVGPGTATLTVTANPLTSSEVQDKMTVTILPNSTEQILNTTETIDLKDVHYYVLNKAVRDEYKDKNVVWTEVTAEPEIALLDTNTNIVHFKKAGEYKVKATIGSASQELTLKVSKTDNVTKLSGIDTYNTQTIKVGNRFQFIDAESKPVKPEFDAETANLVTCVDETNFIYVPNTGTKEIKYVTIGENSIPFVISEDVVDIKATNNLDLWPNYTTNSEKVNVGQKISVYPTTATLEDGSLPEIQYTYDADDKESLVWPIIDNTLQFVKPAMVRISATFGTISKNYSVKSYAGLNGKFSMKDESGTIQSGITYDSLNIGASKTLTIDEFQLPDIDKDSAQTLMKGFTFTSLNASQSISGESEVVSLSPITYDAVNKTLQFTFTAKAKGEDVIVISNGSFTFYVNVKITDAKINNFHLFCNDESVGSNETAYTKDLKMYIGIDPISATSLPYKVTANGVEIEHPSNSISLKEENWDADNKCQIVVSTLDSSVSKTFNLTYSSETPTVSIKEAVEIGGKKDLYIRAGAKYVAATLKVNGLIDKKYYQDNFKIIGDQEKILSYSIISNTLLITIPDATHETPGFEADVKLAAKNSSWEQEYHLSRDIVSRIVLPKNENDSASDQKGMQKVHVYGNKTFYSQAEANVDYYKVEVDLYDFMGNKIIDLDEKEQAIKTLLINASNGSSVTYDAKVGILKYKFNQDASKIYTFDEIYNNKFEDKSKDQTISVATKWGTYTSDYQRQTLVNKDYNFVVVEGTNVYNQEGLQANHGDKASIVLQTNFGLEKVKKDNTPLTDENLYRWKTVYGNGYTMNFDARTSYDKDKRPHTPGANDFLTMGFDNVINATLIGCNDSTFENIMKVNKHKYNSIANIGANATTHFAYCRFSNFYQVMTLWGSSTNYIKNCVYNNNGAVCLSISDEGNHTYIQDTGFFKCSNVAIILQKKAGLYLKGDVKVYNFVKNDIFSDIGGHDFSPLWKVFEPVLDEMGFLQWGADGQNHINAYCIALLPDDFYFWNEQQQKYLPSAEAIASYKSTTNHLEKSIDIPILGGVSVWTTKKPNMDPKSPDYGCPSYYQEYDKDGNIKNDELINLINKLSRDISF